MSVATTVSSNSRKIYPESLNAGRGEIRLLSLTGSTAEGTLCGTLSVHTFQDDLRYTALSYAWGDPTKRRDFVLNGVLTTITESLDAALRQLHMEGKATRLWADALCINQADATEISQQVNNMAAIFSKAERTYLWLGARDESQASDEAMDLVAKATRLDANELDPEDRVWKGVNALLQRSWWSRLWVVQESLLSPNPVFKCGFMEVRLEKFRNLHLWVDELGWDLESSERIRKLPLFTRCPYSSFLTYNAHSDIGRGLLPWLVLGKDLDCLLLRDKVYALLSLAGKEARNAIKPDYHRRSDNNEFVKSDFEVMVETGIHLYTQWGGLSPLEATALRGQLRDHSFHLPSWCPDWRKTTNLAINISPGTYAFDDFVFSRRAAATPWLIGKGQSVLDYSTPYFLPADWRTRTESEPDSAGLIWRDIFCFSEDRKVMAVRGLVVDVLDYVSATPWLDIYTGDDPQEGAKSRWEQEDATRAAAKEWEKHVATQKKATYLTGCSSKEALWRTLIGNRDFALGGAANQDLVSDVPDKIYGTYFDAWMGREPWVNSVSRDLVRKFASPAVARCAKRAFVTTRDGYYAMADAEEATPQVGDVICILRGGHAPAILRPLPGTNYCQYLGRAYVHGIMEGELMQTVKPEDLVEIWLA